MTRIASSEKAGQTTSPTPRYRVAADIGGTFTDLVLLGDDGTLLARKVLSTPHDYSLGIEQALRAALDELGVRADDVTSFSHGTTVGTNTIIEGKGARVALVTTRGFRDVLELARFRAPRMYDLAFRKPTPLVERRLRLEITERVRANGDVLVPMVEQEIDDIVTAIREADVEAVAVCLLHSYANPIHEQRLAALLRERLAGISVSASIEIMPQMQEYERSSTVVVNACLRPRMEDYLGRLEQRLSAMSVAAPVMVMQSSGGLLPAAEICSRPVFAIESGPAAGVVGAGAIGGRSGYRDVIVLDIGGTTAKAALIDNGSYSLAPEIEVGSMQSASRLLKGGGYPVQVPTIDLAEIGAGGGSLAWLDRAGGLKVGPQSAGAVPGPACYGLGGTEPTVTDANLYLGYLSEAGLAGGSVPVSREAAARAIEGMAEKMGLEPVAVAHGIHRIANAGVMRVLRSVSSERGRDPADFTMFAIGGNGPLHGPGIAVEMGISRVVVPPVAGLFSALGMIAARVEHQKVLPFYRALTQNNVVAMAALARGSMTELGSRLTREGHGEEEEHEFSVVLNLQYGGQVGTIPLKLSSALVERPDAAEIAAQFHAEHERVFGYRSEKESVRICSVLVSARDANQVSLPGGSRRGDPGTETHRSVWFNKAGWVETPVIAPAALGEIAHEGPLIIEEYDATTLVPPGWTARLDVHDNIVLEMLP